ncbi:Uncharacterised protein [Mycobacterium tuberculosis]|uniref:Uncharacterized protein n=1 Tax=Mycobacterium tuberculosis TaxID=1773 RepID=A0A0U0QSJ4_MYCTX|nr:Uncharacterised protein [Mycobacterium tuberculosis]COV49320.1 Uncharacterised protein [Mycobacterium tuberculosis]COX69764.1 Uncharacterised protein [Mycobacterium tuberculosis]
MLHRFARPLGGDGFVLVADQHVTAALDKNIGGFPPRPGAQFDVFIHQCIDKVDPRLVIPATVTFRGVGG